MAFTLTYSDGQETDYDDDTAWEVDDGVLKMGRRGGEWSVYVSPSHWAVLEVGGQRPKDGDEPEGESDESDAKADVKVAKTDGEAADEAKDDSDEKD
jgi:hypothetical protein